jgi:hypothetical protein
MLRLVLGFLPWIVLAILGERSLSVALGLGLIVAVVVPAVGWRRGHAIKIPEAVTASFFAFLVVAIMVFGWSAIAPYLSLLANGTLMAIAWGSLLLGVPFTLQYAREQVAPEVARTPAFLRVNQYITCVWGLDFSLSMLASIYRLSTADQSPVWKHGWIAFTAGAMLFTMYFPAWYRNHVTGRMPPVPSASSK